MFQQMSAFFICVKFKHPENAALPQKIFGSKQSHEIFLAKFTLDKPLHSGPGARNELGYKSSGRLHEHI